MKTIPKFSSEAEEAEFWDTVPDITEYFEIDFARTYGAPTRDIIEAIDATQDPGPQTRGVVVLHRRLANLESDLRDRNMLVVTPPTFERIDVLIGRILIVPDEDPFVADASSCCYGIVSTRLLSGADSTCIAMLISDALATRSLWTRRHGFLLLLCGNGEHEYRPLVD